MEGVLGLCQVTTGTNIIGTKITLVGSPGFQSPEQLGNESLGLPNDVYALGAVLLVIFREDQYLVMIHTINVLQLT